MSQLKNKILVKGELKNISPIIIGTGKSTGWVDIEVIKDENGNFYIPGTSFKGALRHFLQENYHIPDSLINEFFGSQDAQAIAVFDDLMAINQTQIEIRDGVAINYKTNIAIDGAKYDYEIVPEGYSFTLSIEINIYDEKEENGEGLYKMLATINQVLTNEDKRFCVGAMTTKGFGILRSNNFKVYQFESSSHSWLDYLLNNKLPEAFDFSCFLPYNEKKINYFSISACFKIKNSLIIGSSPSVNEEPDKVPLKSNDKPVLPGTSIKGAIRNRAVRIINTLNGNGEELIKQTFGWADNEGKSKEKYKSRLRIHETYIENVTEKLKNGIKIDRFTGGTIDNALFNTVLLWSKGQESIHIKMELKNAEEWEKGLLLLLLKDLWNADLPLGGNKATGAGVLEGVSAKIVDGHQSYTLTSSNGNISVEGDRTELEKFVNEFINKITLKN
jgi:CRISPR/Cas system CSM-associated protein Csm3 (group 7 of RAMP superfamily)